MTTPTTRHLVACAAVSLLCLSAVVPASAKPPAWASKPMAAAPAALLAVAKKSPAPPDEDVHVLWSSTELSYDAKGVATRRYHVIQVPVTERGVDTIKVLAGTWSSWFQKKPVLSARVIDASGKAHTIDPTAISEHTPAPGSSDVYSDRKRLQAPLPAMAKGVVVETFVEVADHRVPFASGDVEYLWLALSHPTKHLRTVVRAPAKLPLKWEVRGVPLKAKAKVSKGQRVVVLERKDIKPAGYYESYRPLSAPQLPILLVSTGTTWNKVAREYSSLVDKQLEGHGLEAQAKALTKGAKTPRDMVQRILEYIRKELRYTSVQLGDTAVVPRSPATTLKRRFGDCKDLSTLMVAMLRSLGVKAHVALLRAGKTEHVSKKLAGMGMFNHAIVYVAGPGGELWVDPTAPWFDAGLVPAGDQRRLALVAANDTKGLKAIPHTTAKDHGYEVALEIALSAAGPSSLKGSTIGKGAFAPSITRSFAKGGPEMIKRIRNFLKKRYEAKTVDTVTPAEGGYTWSIKLADWGYLEGSSVKLDLNQVSVLDSMPSAMAKKFKPKADEKWWTAAYRKSWLERRNDLVLPTPHAQTKRIVIKPPPGYVVAVPPRDMDVPMGAARWRRVTKKRPDGGLEVLIRFEAPARFTPDQVRQYNQAANTIYDEGSLQLKVELQAQRDMDAKRTKKALRGIQKLARTQQVPSYGYHQTFLLIRAGLGRAAWQEARALTKRHPKSVWSWLALGWALEHDEAGRHLQGGFDRAGSIAAYDKAKKLEPEWFGPREGLARVLRMNAKGVAHAPGSELPRALVEYEWLHDKKAWTHATNHMALLLHMGNDAKLESLARRLLKKKQAVKNASNYLLAAIGRARGAEPALREARGLADGDGSLAMAASLLMTTGALKEAGTIWLDVAQRQPALKQLEGLMRRLAEPAVPWKGHCGTLRDVMLLTAKSQMKKAAALYAKRYRKHLPKDALLAQATALVPLPPEDLVKMATVVGKCEVRTGSDAPKGVVELVFSTPIPKQRPISFFAVPDGGKTRLLPTENSAWPLGYEALLELKSGRKANARAWLTRAWHALNRARNLPALTTALLQTWLTGSGQLTDAQLPLVGGLLNANGPLPNASVKPLTAALAAEKSAQQRAMLSLILAELHRKAGRQKEALALGNALLGDETTVVHGLEILHSQHLHDKAWKAMEALGRKYATHASGSPSARMMLNAALVRTGRYKEAAEVVKPLIHTPNPWRVMVNNDGWNRLFDGRDLAEGLRLIERLPGNGRPLTSGTLHTMATLAAELGDLTKAREMLAKAIASRGELEPEDRYVLGRMAEHVGQPGVAAAYYKQVTKPKDVYPTATYFLARKRLAGLKGKK